MRVPELRAYLNRHRTELDAMLGVDESAGILLARRHSKIMDGLLSSLFPAARATLEQSHQWSPVLLAAVGGYGRELLGVKSDLDVRLLTTEPPEKITPIAEALFYPLWDAGVAIGHQVVNVEMALEGAREDLPGATVLLDWRVIAGDDSAGTELLNRAFAGVFGDGAVAQFMSRLQKEVDERHQRFGGSVYLLEPDVKNGAGGLRDLDIALWAARARWRVSDLPSLVRIGVLVSRAAEEIATASDFLWKVRNHLHRRAGRRNDRLTFDEQEALAKTLGYRSRVDAHPGASDEKIEGAMVEALMSDYYRHARVITRAREDILERATPHVGHRKPREIDLGHGLRSFEGQISVSDAQELWSDPALALRLYATAVSKNTRVLPFARAAVTRAASDPAFGEALRASEEAASLFVGMVCTAKETPFRGGSILAELHDVGLLTAMLPEFVPVVGRVHHDLYHVYTVDVHSITAVDRLRALVRGDLAKAFPLACRLAAEVTRPEILFLATLLHDVGKVIGGKDHSRRGAEMARPILRRLGLAPDDIEEGCYLILQHLVMYHAATRRDFNDPATIAEFSREVHGRDGLRDLYLLTVADLSTTSPTSMTAWKSSMLDNLYVATDEQMSGLAASDSGRAARLRAQVREAWGSTEDVLFLEEFLDTMPERYLLSNSTREIAAHARVVLRGGSAKVSAALVPSRHPDVAELCVVAGDRAGGAGLCVVAGDRPGLLAAITAAIAASRLEVHAAQVHTRRLPDGGVQAVDLFWVRDRADGIEGVERALPKLSRDLEDLVNGVVSPKALATPRTSPWSERPMPMVTTEISIDHRAASGHTVIEVLTRDQPGLLFKLAQALHELGLSIDIAKINTEGNRVADVFYVTEATGEKVAPGARTQSVREGLLAALERGAPRRVDAAS
ncbi:MAG TPA: [protein-PII] uridylyltransferase [Polyangiaceae bacterium]|nr:[protein-PII] uridylyltransferase [Polyangiaceae bacterium]